MISLSQWLPNFLSLQIADYLKNDIKIRPASHILMSKPRNVTIYYDFTDQLCNAGHNIPGCHCVCGETGGQWQAFTVMLHGCISKDVTNL